MGRLLTIGIGLFSAVGILGPAIAAPDSLSSPSPAPSSSQPAKRSAAQRPAPQPPQSPNWSGAQFGGSNGISSVNNNFAEPGAYICAGRRGESSNPGVLGVSCFETPFSFSGHSLSYTVGPFIGYRWQLGSYVAGVEADWSWKNATTSSSAFVASAIAGPNAESYNSTRSDSKTGSVTQNWDSAFRVRYGYLVTPWTLVYATGGVALGKISGAFTFNGVILPAGFGLGTATSNATWSDTRLGGTVGGGVETEIWSGWKLRVEYRYTNYGSYTKSVPVITDCHTCGSPSTSASIDVHESFQTVRVGLGFDF
jgi:outer membrane immunogenic protein